jgi:hypothetical protein
MTSPTRTETDSFGPIDVPPTAIGARRRSVDRQFPFGARE